MGKVVLLAAAGVAVVGVPVGGMYLSRLLSFDVKLPEKMQGLGGFTESLGNRCVGDLFPGIGQLHDRGVAEFKREVLKEGFIGNESEGCLIVNWDKETTKEGDKWRGAFRFLWAVRSGDNGFLAFTLGKAVDKSIKWDGIAFTLEKEGGYWKMKSVLEEQRGKDFKKGSDDNKFPRSGQALVSVKDKPFWGFFDKKDDLEKVCGEEECKGWMEQKLFRGQWIWKGEEGGSSKMTHWTQELYHWWDEIYENDLWNMDHIVQLKQGKWKEITCEEMPFIEKE